MRYPVLVGFLLLALTVQGVAQQAPDTLGSQNDEIGKLKVRTQTYPQALGVISELARSSPEQNLECNGGPSTTSGAS